MNIEKERFRRRRRGKRGSDSWKNLIRRIGERGGGMAEATKSTENRSYMFIKA